MGNVSSVQIDGFSTRMDIASKSMITVENGIRNLDNVSDVIRDIKLQRKANANKYNLASIGFMIHFAANGRIELVSNVHKEPFLVL